MKPTEDTDGGAGPASAQVSRFPPEPVRRASPRRGVTAQNMRTSNRLLLLHLIRDHAPVTRPRLAELSGIHRSNVALIADALVGDGLVEESAGSVQGRGRVASLLRIAVSRPVVLGISVRPDETTGLLARLDGTTERVFCFTTPDSPEELLELLRRHGRALWPEGPADGTAVDGAPLRAVLAVPGRVLPGEGLWMPDFPKYKQFPLQQRLEALLQVPVLLANGGNVAAVAAMRMESEKTAQNLAFVAVHDRGVGGGIIADGRLYSGFDGTFAGEFGHMIVSGKGPRCACGAVGCWGELVSNHAVWARLRQAAGGSARSSGFGTESYRRLLAEAQGQPGSALREQLDRCLAPLLAGVRNIVMTLNPQQIVIAGEITRAWDALREHPLVRGTHPGFWSRVHPARLPLAELYELGTVQHGLSSIFDAGDEAELSRHMLRAPSTRA